MQTQYRFLIENRSYTDWKIINVDTNVEIDSSLFPKINPIQEKIFSKDIFTYDFENPQIPPKMIHSNVKSGIELAGVLVLQSNKTYGRTANKKRLLYKCIPDDRHYPFFLVPFEPKMGFSKTQKNKYIIFKFDHWKEQIPHGLITETLGDVGELNVFYEYQLYCKSLHLSLTSFTNKVKEQIQKKKTDEFILQIMNNPDFQVEDRRNRSVFTIDPKGSTDFDDGFSISPGNIEGTWNVSVYIANVYFWLETMGLWKSFSSRVSTIYLPDRRRPMLPTILSENLCSLQQNEDRFVFVMDLVVTDSGNILAISFKNAVITVYKNYEYEEPQLLYNDASYRQLFDISFKMNQTIKDSHDLVSHWMVFMNQKCGEYMANHKIGIFRTAVNTSSFNHILENQPSISNLPLHSQRVIQNWKHTAGQYTLFKDGLSLNHICMNIESYIHITSPIRRLVDLLNQMWMSMTLSIISNVSADAMTFFENWLHKMECINTSMRSIRKIQTDCELMHRCFTNPEIMDILHEGIIFDKMVKNDGTMVYMVYLENIKLLSRIHTHIPLENYSRRNFKVFLFEDEEKVKRKIRLQLIA